MNDDRDNGVKRRAFLGGVAATLAASSALAQPPAGAGGRGGGGGRGGAGGAGRTPQPLAPAVTPPQVTTPGRPQANDKFGPSVDNVKIIDAHIHLFDGSRPTMSYQGSAQYKAISSVNIPSFYAPLARAAGISGAIMVEASGAVEDNQWYIDTVEGNDIMVGCSGRLDPNLAGPDFGKNLERFHKSKYYLAMRCSTFHTTDAEGNVTLNPVAVANLKLLADAGLAQDTANPSLPLMKADVLLADAIPHARIIMDHMPNFNVTPENKAMYDAVLREMGKRPNISVKLSEVYNQRTVAGDYSAIKAILDQLYETFGEDRVMFGSDYPNSYGLATISEEVGLMKKYFATKTKLQAEKYFWRNAAHIYKYVPRRPDQPKL